VIVNDPEYREALGDLSTIVENGQIYLALNDLNGVASYLATMIRESINNGDMTEENALAAWQVLNVHVSLYDTLTDEFAGEVVPDTIEGLDNSEES
jgi:hypothetical protein